MTADLTFLRKYTDRCYNCLLHIPTQGHRLQLADGTPTGCTPSGPIGLMLARQGRDTGMAQTVAAHPDDAARVDQVLAKFIATKKPFTANDTRPELVGVKGSVIGSRFSAASKANRIRRTGNRFPSTDPATHAHHIDEWIAA